MNTSIQNYRGVRDSASKEVDRVLAIQTDYSTPAAALGRRAHSHCEALSLAAFLVDKVWRSHSSYGADSLDHAPWTPIKIRIMESGGLHASIEESSRFFSVETVALPNLPQTDIPRARALEIGVRSQDLQDVYCIYRRYAESYRIP